MSDEPASIDGAYRTAPFSCPTCRNTSLREFQERLVCDECSGMLIADDDFAASIHELDNGTEPLVVSDEQASQSACPRCQAQMKTCTLAVGALVLRGRFLRCPTDGLWVPRSAMTATFARASRKAHHGYAGGRTGSAGGLVQPGGSGGLAGAMNSIGQAFGGGVATGGLAIGNWRSSRPRVHTLFVSAHKDRTLACPACKSAQLEYAGDRWSCATCAGSFVEDEALAAMVMEMANQPWEVPHLSGSPGDRACPVCAQPMVVEKLEGVTIDRCAPHGTWFDDTELQSALGHASAASPGLASWIKRLWHRGSPA
jgi:ribosomal protein L37AE/L43A